MEYKEYFDLDDYGEIFIQSNFKKSDELSYCNHCYEAEAVAIVDKGLAKELDIPTGLKIKGTFYVHFDENVEPEKAQWEYYYFRDVKLIDYKKIYLFSYESFTDSYEIIGYRSKKPSEKPHKLVYIRTYDGGKYSDYFKDKTDNWNTAKKWAREEAAEFLGVPIKKVKLGFYKEPEYEQTENWWD